MPSGKQLDFQYGEISPLQKFKSSIASYDSACELLYNFFVRRTGGISNRPGTLLEGIQTENFDNLMENGFDALLGEGAPIPIRSFHVHSDEAGDVIITVIRDPATTDEYQIFISTDPGVVQGTIILEDPFELEKLDITYMKGYFVITPSTKGYRLGGTGLRVDRDIAMAVREDMAPDPLERAVITFDRDTALLTEVEFSTQMIGLDFKGHISGPVPNFPVTYLVTVLTRSGIETPYFILGTSVDSGGEVVNVVGIQQESGIVLKANIYHPVSEGDAFLDNTLLINFNAVPLQGIVAGVPAGVVALKIYRASEGIVEGETNSFNKNFIFVGKAAVEEGDGDSTPISFSDYGTEDPSDTAPVDRSMLDDLANIANVECGSVYQQRLFLGVKSSDDDNTYLKSGSVMASKVGQGVMMHRNISVKNTGAFPFEVPIEESSRVVSMIAHTRLICLTERSATLVAGSGQQGIIVPGEVNPLNISNIGCSKRVRAKRVNNYGVYLNNSHNKLMSILFSNNGVSVEEASMLSEHLITPDVCQLEVIEESSGDSKIYLLKRDGTLVSVTIGSEGVFGFSRYEFPNAKVISIYRTKRVRQYDERQSDIGFEYDSLGMYVQRNNFITREILDERIDSKESQSSFLDCSIAFGSRLTKDGSSGYKAIPIGSEELVAVADEPRYINIEAADFSSGQPITIVSSYDLSTNKFNDDVAIQFFYMDGSEEKSIILKVDWDSSSFDGGSGTYSIECFCDEDIPEYLRDVSAQDLTSYEKAARQSRWLGALKQWTDALSNSVEDLSKLRILYCALDPSSLFDYTTDEIVLQDGSYPLGAVVDGRIISAPLDNEPLNEIKLESSSSVLSLDQFPDYVSFGYVGVPYESEVQTLPIEPSDSRTFTDSRKIVDKVGLALYNSYNPYVGGVDEDNSQLVATKTRNETDLSIRDKLFSGHVAPVINSRWTEEGRVSVKNLSPAPVTILSIYPKGISGE
jgi:hypothetical protein